MKKILNGLFLGCAFLAVALAFGYVAVEAAAVVIGNGALTVWAETYLEAPVCIMCSLTAITAFLMSYVFRWTSGD